VTVYVIGLLGVFVGIAAGILGAGPSILTVLVLRHVAGLDIGTAIVTSLLVVAWMSVVAVVPYVATRSIDWRCAAAFGIGSMTGAYVTGRASTLLSPRALLSAFLVAMVVAAAAMLYERPAPEAGSCRRPASMLVLAAFGALVGGVTGVVGLGGGFAVVPILVLFARTPMREAIGTSILLIGVNTLAAFASHLPHPHVDWTLATTLGAAECAGSLVAAVIAKRLSAGLLRRGFAVVMLATAVIMLGREIQGYTFFLPDETLDVSVATQHREHGPLDRRPGAAVERTVRKPHLVCPLKEGRHGWPERVARRKAEAGTPRRLVLRHHDQVRHHLVVAVGCSKAAPGESRDFRAWVRAHFGLQAKRAERSGLVPREQNAVELKAEMAGRAAERHEEAAHLDREALA
jgi:uncharacterized membrane protein YfcA